LGQYLYEPVKTYSAGMRARLAFAISMVIEFDCFLIDEIVAVGDSRFHQKCEIELFEKRKDRAMIIVSHQPEQIVPHCDRVAVLHRGKIFDTQVKSRLLPLSPVASAIEWLIERLPRRLIHIELIPIDDVQIIDEVRGEYKSTGHEANFEMIVEPAIPRQGGWYYLEAALVRNNGCRDACIRVFVRGKNKEIIVIPIPTNLRGSVREVFYLPPNVFALIWSPTGAAGYFSQSRLLLHKITALESTLRRISRVIFDLWRFRNNASVIHAALAWLRALGNLQVAYQLTVQLRLNRLMGNDYASFIALNDSLSKADVLAMQQQASRLTRRPLISVIMPVRAPMA
ncbi:MAG: hypothetical protein ABL915_01310, partial [Gallionella sp.]